MKLILASASARRAQILRDAGLPFQIISSAIDEALMEGESPQDLVRRLAEQKAQLVAARAVGPAIVVGADTVVVLEGKILGKPRSAEEARAMLEQLSGRTHAVITGIALIRLPDEAARQEVETTEVTFAPMTAEEISGYVSTGEPFDKAGAYAIQGRGGRHVTRIEGDYFNVVGLPLGKLYRLLKELGWKES
jgi:septum formation protein